MMLPLLLLGLGMYADRVSVHCKNLQVKQTAAVRNVDGVAVALRLHSEDDHGKNTHLCQTEYELVITHPGGSTSETGWDDLSDGEWDRAITFGVQGFTADGQRALALVFEGGRPPSIEVMVYDLRTDTHDAIFLDSGFLKRMGACAQSLHVEGLTTRGDIVLKTEAHGTCGQKHTWRLTARKTKTGNNVAEPLRVGVQVVPLARGTDEGEKPR